MKTNEEMNALKNEVETLYKKLAELTDEELQMVTGGRAPDVLIVDSGNWIQGLPSVSM